MNAFNMVNMAAACLVTTVDKARALGIPEEKWTYILGAAGTSESSNRAVPDSLVRSAELTNLQSLGTTQLHVQCVSHSLYRCGLADVICESV